MVTDIRAIPSKAVIFKALATTSESTSALCIHYYYEELAKCRQMKPGLTAMILSDLGQLDYAVPTAVYEGHSRDSTSYENTSLWVEMKGCQVGRCYLALMIKEGKSSGIFRPQQAESG